MRRILLLVLVCGISSRAAAQDSVTGIWATGGVGLGSTRLRATATGNFAGELAVHAQRDAWTGSLRYHAVGGVGNVEERALTPMIGRATTGTFGFASASIGPSLVWRRDCTGGCGFISDTPRRLGASQGGVGLMFAGDVALRAPADAGLSLGLTAFANANTQVSFIGFALEVGLGRFR